MAGRIPNPELVALKESLRNVVGTADVLNALNSFVEVLVERTFSSASFVDAGTDEGDVPLLGAEGKLDADAIPDDLNFTGTPEADPYSRGDESSRQVVTLAVLLRFLRWQVVVPAVLYGDKDSSTVPATGSVTIASKDFPSAQVLQDYRQWTIRYTRPGEITVRTAIAYYDFADTGGDWQDVDGASLQVRQNGASVLAFRATVAGYGIVSIEGTNGAGGNFGVDPFVESLVRSFARVSTSDAAARTGLATLMNAAVADAEKIDWTALVNVPEDVTEAEAEAGTETDVRMWSPQRVSQAIAALATGGGGGMGGVSLAQVNSRIASAVRDFAEAATTDTAARTAIASLMAAATADAEKLSFDDLKDTPADVTQAEAEAGTVTDIRSWTPQRVSQAIAALADDNPATVTQAEAEAGTVTDIRSWTPQRVAQAIAALATGGSTGGVTLAQIRVFARTVTTDAGARAALATLLNAADEDSERIDYTELKGKPTILSSSDVNTAIAGRTRAFARTQTSAANVRSGIVSAMDGPASNDERLDYGDLKNRPTIPALPAAASAGEVTAGTETGTRLFSPKQIKDAVEEHESTGGTGGVSTTAIRAFARTATGDVASRTGLAALLNAATTNAEKVDFDAIKDVPAYQIDGTATSAPVKTINVRSGATNTGSATESGAGTVELATAAEMTAGNASRVPTAARVKAYVDSVATAASAIRDFAKTATTAALVRSGIVSAMDSPAQDSERLDYEDLKNKPTILTQAQTDARVRAGTRTFARPATTDVAARTAIATLMNASAADAERIDYGDLKGTPADVTQAEAEAGTVTANRTWSPARVKQAIDALGGSGGSSRSFRRHVNVASNTRYNATNFPRGFLLTSTAITAAEAGEVILRAAVRVRVVGSTSTFVGSLSFAAQLYKYATTNTAGGGTTLAEDSKFWSAEFAVPRSQDIFSNLFAMDTAATGNVYVLACSPIMGTTVAIDVWGSSATYPASTFLEIASR